MNRFLPPKVDIFVCTADPEREPAMMVMNTVLSAMAYDYPKEKLSVYLSDDAASQITFYAFFEASIFGKHWLPYCKTFNIQHPSPSAYFSNATNIPHDDHTQHQHFLLIKVSSPWFIPFAYVILGETIYCIYEFLSCGGTIKGWWNEQRIWLYKRSSSYLFSFIDNMLNLLGFSSDSGFTITTKVADDEVSERFKKEIMEFGNSSPMFTVLATLALLNLFCLLGVIIYKGIGIIERMVLQVILCGVLVIINIPIYQALFFRKDKGRLPSSVAIKSTALALAACVLFKAVY